MTKTTTLAILALTFLQGGCAITQPNVSNDDKLAFVEATKAELKEPLPVPVTETIAVPAIGQLKLLPHAEHASGAATPPHKVIENANQAARQSPDIDGYYNAIMAYDYDDGALYRVYCAPLKLTDIQLQPGERMISNPGAADTTRWKVGASVSMVNGVEQQHLLVTPKRPDIETSLYIYTDRRTYHLELYSYKTTYMAAVSWNYATDTLETFNLQMDNAQAKNDDIDAARVDLTNANFAYTIEVKNGEPAWTPIRVFDNGKKTFIQFPNIISVSDSPALYISKYGEHELVNYRPVGDFYVIDGVFPRYELRVGTNEHMDIVEIINDDHGTRSSRAAHRTSLFSDEES